MTEVLYVHSGPNMESATVASASGTSGGFGYEVSPPKTSILKKVKVYAGSGTSNLNKFLVFEKVSGSVHKLVYSRNLMDTSDYRYSEIINVGVTLEAGKTYFLLFYTDSDALNRLPANQSPSTLSRVSVYAGNLTFIQVNGTYSNTIQSMVQGTNYSVTLSANSAQAYVPNMEITLGPVNTPPTTPGAFTQPSGTLEIGDTKVFSVGASSDAEGNLSKYVWEVSLNVGAYTKVGETSVPNFTYTIPTATSLKMRVKAVDSGGLESAYRESSVYTVSKPVYYWSKYNTITNSTYSDTAPWQASGDSFKVFVGASNSYTFNPTTNRYSKAGSTYMGGQPVYAGSVAYEGGGSTITRYVAKSGGDPSHGLEVTVASKNASNNNGHTSYSKGSLIQSDIQAQEGTYPTDGRHSDGYWYVRGSRVSQSIAPPGKFTAPTTGKAFKPNELASITFEASSAPNISAYEVDYRYGTGAWTPLAYNNTLSRSLTITNDKSLKTLELRVRAKNTSNIFSDFVYSESFVIEHNVAPTVTLTQPGDNTTLYENDTLNIAGTAYDADPDQSVTVYYQINNEPRKVLATNLSQTQISLSKQLKFKGGKIYDGDTALTDTLADGVAHTLKVWAEDSEKASSVIVERSFYVVPNRAPLLSVDAVVPSGIVDADKFKISGNASDQDANSNIKVTQRINGGNAIEIYNGTGGTWEFDVSLAQLTVGENTIIIEVIDNYGAKTSKTIKLNKSEVKTPILNSVARYKIEPPKGSAKGVLLWVQRDTDLDLTVELSMTLQGEQESYETLTATNTAPVDPETVEDEFYFEADEAKNNIILKLSTSRTDVNIDHKIHLISGVLE